MVWRRRSGRSRWRSAGSQLKRDPLGGSHTMVVRTVLPLLLIHLFGACGPPSPQPSTQPVQTADARIWAGCYSLRPGSWSPDSSLFEVPATIRLEPTLGSLGRRSVLPDARWNSRRFFRGYWRSFGDDSVKVYWTTGLWGLGLALRPAGDSLFGRVWELHDMLGPVYPSMQVSAVRSSCPADSLLRE